MVWLALGGGVLLFGLWVARVFATAPPETIRRAGYWVVGIFGTVLLGAVLLTGRGAQVLWMLAVFAPLLWRRWQAWRAARRFGSQAADASTVETAMLAMRLDHATGQMSGRVRRGSAAGRELAELTLSELLALLAECRAGDPDSVPLLEAWMDRAAPDWRAADAAYEHTAGGEAPRSPAGGPMTRAEALAVLGLTEGADPAAIRAAHRRLMRAAHPDQGGSTWLAARINQARDLLLP
jgi:hypothetical protein